MMAVCPHCYGAGCFSLGLLGERIPQFSGVNDNTLWPPPGTIPCEACGTKGYVPAREPACNPVWPQ